MKPSPLLLALLLTLSGCQLVEPLLSPVPAGVVTGTVLFNGQPAAGKRVSLLGAEKKAYTDANGRYTFSNVSGKVTVSYQRAFDTVVQDADDPRLPNEVERWQSASFTLEGSGKEVPPFDVAYNGHLYPDKGMSLIVNATSPVPFHWSTHPQAQKYRVKVTNVAGDFSWASEWVTDPTTIFAKAVSPGTYRWAVEIDGGDRGFGASRPRQVDF